MKVSNLLLMVLVCVFSVSIQNVQASKMEGKEVKVQKDSVPKVLFAKSVLGQKAPKLVVEEWVSKKPETKGKFVLIDFWATTCNPCREVIPELNEWSKKFKKDLVIIGISYEKAEKVKAMKTPVIEYYNGVDTKKTMSKELEIQGIPHIILINPDGIVCWEGYPLWPTDKLTAELLEKIIKEYKNKNKK